MESVDLETRAREALRSARAGGEGAAGALTECLGQLRALADAGDVRAATVYGELAVEAGADSAAVLRYLDIGVRAGDPVAMRVKGHALVKSAESEGDLREAAELFGRAADVGDAYAMLNLAMLYGQGRGVGRDPVRALALTRAAAEARLPVAMALLADRLSALDQDAEALSWYVRAAQAGLPQAMYAAGCWFRDGIGTRADAVQALRWLLAMQNHGSSEGTHDAVQLALTMPAEQVREAARLSGRETDGEVLVEMREARQGA